MPKFPPAKSAPAKSRLQTKKGRRSLAKRGGASGSAHASPDRFGRLASEIAVMAGRPAALLAAVAAIALWLILGVYFNYSDTWLLFINTAGTIVTVLMVFLIQNTHNRDTLALQLKLAELILFMEGAENRMAPAEDLSHEDLQDLKEDVRTRRGTRRHE